MSHLWLFSACFAARNRISLTCADPGQFVVMVYIARQRSVDEVKALMKPPLPLPAAVERVQKQVHELHLKRLYTVFELAKRVQKQVHELHLKILYTVFELAKVSPPQGIAYAYVAVAVGDVELE